MKKKILRITTVLSSQQFLLKGQLQFMESQGFDVVSVSADDKRSAHRELDASKYHFIPFQRRFDVMSDIACLFKLIKLIRRERPDIVHTHTPKAGLLGMMAAWLCRVPARLHTVAGMPLLEFKGLAKVVLKVTETLTYFFATKVYPNSKELRDYILSDFYVDGSKISVIGNGSSNGIDTSFFMMTEHLAAQAKQLRQQVGASDDDLVCCFVGRIVRDKGVNELLRAFDSLQSKRKLRLILVGPFEQDLDPLSEADMNMIRTHERIYCAGFQDDIRPWLAASDIFLFPSYREGFPNVVLQAGCMELPIIASDINGCNEIISHGNTGLLVPAKDSAALAVAIEQLASDPQLRRSFGVKVRQFIVSNFDRQYLWNELLGEYRRVLN